MSTNATGLVIELMKQLEDELLTKLTPRLLEQLLPHLRDQLAATLTEKLRAELEMAKPWKKNIFIPSMDVYQTTGASSFMTFSTCSSRDFFHPEFKRLSDMMRIPPVFHRKYWEWVFIVHQVLKHASVKGKHGLGFGVGSEPLPAAFAALGARITATDAPANVGVGCGWLSGGDYASGTDSLLHEGIIDGEEFRSKVSFRECDMNDIPADLVGFDFCWSSCCLEHLGNLRKGIDFIINSVERTLKIGGVACHTTEFNLSSNEQTVESGATVIYRKSDIDTLITELRHRGHEVEEFRLAPDSISVDGYVDTPPYAAPPHLKLALEGFTSTSMGLIIRRGK